MEMYLEERRIATVHLVPYTLRGVGVTFTAPWDNTPVLEASWIWLAVP